MLFLCADIGTSRMKIAITNGNGEIIVSASKDLSMIKEQEGFCEMDMDVVWDTFKNICVELREINPDSWNALAGVGVTGQGDGLWVLDNDGKQIRPAILWNDTRTKNIKIPDIDEFCISHSTNVPFAGSFHMILKWLKLNEPHNFNRISHILHCKDWINYNLTGNYSCDHSDASLAGYNLFEKDYSRELFKKMDIQEASKLLPNSYSSSSIVGTISEKASQKTGIPVNLPVIAGALDICSVAHGVGVRAPGDTCVIIGTTLCTEVVIRKDQVDLRRGMVACHAEDEMYLSVMPTLSGTTSFDWTKSLLYPNHSYKELEEELATVPIGSKGIIYHPFLYGERAPFRNPSARAGFYGLSAIHTRKEIMRSVFEGIALSIRDCLSILPESKGALSVCGGGSVSDLLCNIISDCTDRTVRRTHYKEAGIKGISDILFKSLSEFNRSEKKENPTSIPYDFFYPNSENTLKYDYLYMNYKHLINDLESFWSSRSNSIIDVKE